MQNCTIIQVTALNISLFNRRVESAAVGTNSALCIDARDKTHYTEALILWDLKTRLSPQTAIWHVKKMQGCFKMTFGVVDAYLLRAVASQEDSVLWGEDKSSYKNWSFDGIICSYLL